LDENRTEARRHRWRRYYYRKIGKQPAVKPRSAPTTGPKKYEHLFIEEPIMPKPKTTTPKPQFIKRREKGG
jgi:hypothetical protein